MVHSCVCHVGCWMRYLEGMSPSSSFFISQSLQSNLNNRGKAIPMLCFCSFHSPDPNAIDCWPLQGRSPSLLDGSVSFQHHGHDHEHSLQMAQQPSESVTALLGQIMFLSHSDPPSILQTWLHFHDSPSLSFCCLVCFWSLPVTYVSVS